MSREQWLEQNRRGATRHSRRRIRERLELLVLVWRHHRDGRRLGAVFDELPPGLVGFGREVAAALGRRRAEHRRVLPPQCRVRWRRFVCVCVCVWRGGGAYW